MDYEKLFSTELYKKLKEKVKGRVFVKIDHILNGLSTSYLSYSILKDYRKFVNKQYFK